MTSPVAPLEPREPESWIQNLIQRYTGQKPIGRQEQKDLSYRRPKPIQQKPERSANLFDPSSYYSQLNQIQNIASIGHERETRPRHVPKMGTPTGAAEFVQTGTRGGLGVPLQSYSTTSGYGHRHNPVTGAWSMHSGIDLAAPEGTPIYATHDGYVATAGNAGGYGLLVVIDGGNGIQTKYAHQSQLAVQPGQQVRQGQLIGYVGSTGQSTGPHLHYEVWINGRSVDPRSYL